MSITFPKNLECSYAFDSIVRKAMRLLAGQRVLFAVENYWVLK
ncbi:hypothetical protein [Bartonella sp. DGB2]